MLPERKEKVPVKRGEMVSWSPPDVLREMDRMFEDFRRSFWPMLAPIGSNWMRPWFAPFSLPEVRAPSADMIDSGSEYRVCAEIPGIPKESLNVTVSPRSMEIEAEAKTDIKKEDEGFVRRERGYSRIYRRFSFPEEIVPDKAEATLNDGVLEVRVPKKTPTEVQKHKVEIK